MSDLWYVKMVHIGPLTLFDNYSAPYTCFKSWFWGKKYLCLINESLLIDKGNQLIINVLIDNLHP